MKRFFVLLSVLALTAMSAFSFAACGGKVTPGDKAISVVAPDGAPLLSLTKMWAEDFKIADGYDVTYQSLTGGDPLTTALMKSEPDIAIAPINVCAKVYNEGKGYRFAGVSIWGIMHIVTNSTAQTVALDDIKGKNIVAFQKAATPGITLRAVLTQNNIGFTENLNGSVEGDKVNILYLADAPAVQAAVVAGKITADGDEIAIEYALLPEPVATAITGATKDKPQGQFWAKINLQNEWKAKNNGDMYPQAGLIFHERLLASDKAFVDKFIEMAAMSTAWAAQNPEAAGNLAKEKLGSTLPGGTPIKAAVNAGRLPLNFTYAADAKTAAAAYLGIIFNDNGNNLVGGKLPDDTFYYAK
ncbi:MAG: hypothetical protein LBP26_00595 [Clostridiales bacterium]|jgi:NitT/TauT family transport system substrate-binding protein|nr:hypothetical protein [Clostridiales bacterium]